MASTLNPRSKLNSLQCVVAISYQFLRYSGSFASFPKPRFFTTYGFDDEESPAFHHARLFRKPLSTKYNFNLANSVSLVGFVDRPIRVVNNESDSFGVFTVLRVVDPRSNTNRSFRIPISIWGVMAHKCNAHLKPNDHILVSGHMFTYNKRSNNENNNLALDCQVRIRVTKVNYMVPPRSDVADSQIFQVSKSETVSLEEESKNDETYLWQVFFANPYEWWDNRKDKKNPKQPDFKHKDTNESLWLDSRTKPDWVSKQLELFDQRNADKIRYVQEHTRSGHLSDWV